MDVVDMRTAPAADRWACLRQRTAAGRGRGYRRADEVAVTVVVVAVVVVVLVCALCCVVL